jgi:cell division protein FtsL
MRKTNKKANALNKIKIYLVFWAFLAMVFSTVIFMQVRKQSSLATDITALDQQITDANAEQQKLQQAIHSKTSNEAVAKYAHSQLGLVYPNEIIIYNDNYQNGK